MPGPGRIYTIAERHRRELLAGERAAATEMVRYYGATWQRLKVNLDALLERVEQARQAGERVSPAWLYQETRYRALMAQVETEMAGLARYVESTIVAQQAQAIALAQEHARQLVLQGLEPAQITIAWNRLPVGAVEQAVGFMRPDSPLHKLLARLPGEAAKDIERELVVGVATGAGPRQTARRIRKALGGNSARALTIARTETLRAYREATHQSYLANSDVLDGWMWLCSKSDRTCVACLAMDGTVHKLKERLDDHPNGRCVMAPLPKGVEMPKRQTGAEWFAEQSPEIQRQMLGNKAYEAYKAGTVTLQDFVGRKRSKDWGSSIQVKSLKELLGAAATSRPSRTLKELLGELATPRPSGWRRPTWLPKQSDREEAFGRFRTLYTEQRSITPEALKQQLMRNLAHELEQDKDWQAMIRLAKEIDDYSILCPMTRWGDTDGENAAATLIHNWAMTSMDNDRLAVAIQRIAEEEFGLKSWFPRGVARPGDPLWDSIYYTDPVLHDGLKAFIRAQYNQTQAWLKEKGIEEIVLYRGMYLDPQAVVKMGLSAESPVVQVPSAALQPISSFSWDYEMARGFAMQGQTDRSVLLASVVPRERIFSTPWTGFGCHFEAEMVVLSGETPAYAVFGSELGRQVEGLWKLIP